MTDLRGRLKKVVATAAANTQVTATVPAASGWRRVVGINIKYSAAPTHTGMYALYDSEDGSAYDALLVLSAANVQYLMYIPVGDGIWLAPNDALSVVAPAGGAGIVAGVTVIYK